MLSRRIHQLSPVWIMTFILLSTAPELRIGDVQFLELLQVTRFVISIAFFAFVGLRLPKTEVWRRYGRGYLLLLALACLMALISLRLPFYPPSGISILKQPLILSASRLFELAFAIYFMLAISDSLERKPELLRSALTTYSVAGTISAVASLIGFVVFQTSGETTYFINELDHRAQGFFNEGGPYGLFLTSVILVLLMRRRLFPNVSRLWHRSALVLVAIAWILSSSKAGLLAAILCGAVAITLISDIRKRVLAAVLLPSALVLFFVLFQRGLSGYVNSISGFDETVNFRPDDRNLVMGRIVAFFIIPRMIVAHPLLGIGVGNYSLMRNDPDYLQGLPAVDDWDLPGLGIISDAAELGIPLALYLIWLVSRPFRDARRRKVFPVVLATAAFQPIALLLGVNVNFFYPWLVSGFVLASLFVAARPGTSLNVSLASPLR